MKFWVARDEDRSLWMFDDKPIKIKNFWGVNRESEKYIQSKPAKPLYNWYFQEVTFENSPQQVEIKLIKEE
jgi:hypothetical protein